MKQLYKKLPLILLGLPLIVLILLIYGRYLLLYDHLSLNTTLNSSESKDTRQLT